MTKFLKQSTALTVIIGPFIDDTDGKTAETGLTVADINVDLYKGSTKSDLTITASGGSNDMAHVANGFYSLELTTGNTDTLGLLIVTANIAGALPVWADYMVMPANAWDSLFGADYLQVDLTQIGGAAVSTSTAQLGVNAVQAGGTAWGSGAITAASIATDAITAAKVAADAVTEIQSGLATAAALTTIDDFLDTEIAAILADTNELQTDWVNGGRLDLLIDAIKAKTDNLPTDPADQSAVEAAITAATSPLATAASIAALNDISTADVNAQVVDALATDTYAEPGSVPAATSSLKDKIAWLFMLARNERRTTATSDLVRNDANSATVGTSTLSDDGTTFTRGEYA